MCFDVLPRLTERKWSMNSSKPAMSCDQILKLQRKSFSIRRDFQTDEIHKIFCGFSFHLISCSKFGARAYFSSGERPVKICWSCKDDGAALFSQITNLLERLENMEREWKTRKKFTATGLVGDLSSFSISSTTHWNSRQWNVTITCVQ